MTTMSSRRAIERAVAGLARVWNSHDPEAFARLFTPHGELITLFGHRLVGRLHIARFYASLFVTVLSRTTQTLNLLDAKRIGPGVTMAALGWRLAEHGPRGIPVSAESRGIAQVVFVRTCGELLVAMMHTTQTSATGFVQNIDETAACSDDLFDQCPGP